MTTFWKYTKRGLQISMGRALAGRNLNVFPDDVFVVSYPRSGNTWMRFLLGNLASPEDPITFANIESRIPEIYLSTDRVLRRLPRPRILKSHEYFDHRYRRVIYILRDPRDVAVSLYHYSIKRRDIPDDYSIERFVPRFIEGEFFEDFGTWHDHVSSWLATRKSKPGFLLLRYESMLADPAHELAKGARLLGLNATPDMIARAVQLSSADLMRKLESQQSEAWKLTKGTRQEPRFVRVARSGAWRSELPPKSIQQIEGAWGSLMRDLGYELSDSAETVYDKPAFVLDTPSERQN